MAVSKEAEEVVVEDSFTEDDWSEIYNLSLKTYVDESDKSRERTAGAGLTDND